MTVHQSLVEIIRVHAVTLLHCPQRCTTLVHTRYSNFNSNTELDALYSRGRIERVRVSLHSRVGVERVGVS